MWLLMEVPSRSWSGVVSLELGPVAPIRALTDTGPLSGVPPGLEGPDIKHGHIIIIMLTRRSILGSVSVRYVRVES